MTYYLIRVGVERLQTILSYITTNEGTDNDINI